MQNTIHTITWVMMEMHFMEDIKIFMDIDFLGNYAFEIHS